MSLKSYEIPWRPTVEIWAVGGWFLATGYMAALAITRDMPPIPLWAMTGVSSLFMLRRTIGMFKQSNGKKRLKRGKLWFLPWLKFEKKLDAEAGSYIGKTFTWNASALEKSQEILDSNDTELLGKKVTQAYWLHGVGKKEQDSYYSLEMQFGHTLVAGTTGAGKGVCFCAAITQAIMRDEAVIIIDPKGDLNIQNAIKAACLARSDPERYHYFHPSFPDKSVRIDPLRNWNRRTEIASRITTLIPSESGSDAFTNFCWKVLNSVAQGLFETGEAPSLKNLRKYIEGDAAPLLIRALRSHFSKTTDNWENRILKYTKRKKTSEVQNYIDFYRIEVAPTHQSTELEGLISTVEHNREHFQKMIISLIPILSMLTDDSLGPLLSPDPTPNPNDPRTITDTKRVIEKGQVLYVSLDSLSDATVGSAIGSMLLADCASVAGDRFAFGVGDRPVNIFIDEAAEVINEPTVQLLNKGRSAKFRVYIATQTLADFEHRLGSEAAARKVLGNINTKFVLRLHDDKSQKYFSEQMPEVTIRGVDHQYRTGASSSDPNDFSGMYSESLVKEKTSMIPPSLLGMLPDMHYFAKMADGRVLKGRLPIVLLDRVEPQTKKKSKNEYVYENEHR